MSVRERVGRLIIGSAFDPSKPIIDQIFSQPAVSASPYAKLPERETFDITLSPYNRETPAAPAVPAPKPPVKREVELPVAPSPYLH